MLDTQAKALLDLMVARGVPPTHTLSPSEARTFYRDRRTLTQPDPPAVAEVRDLSAAGPAGPIPLRLYRPASAPHPSPTLVFFHGGGWVIGDLDTHDVVCRSLAVQANCAVLAVDYRMGPDHRFPAAVDDCIAATQWLHAQAASLQLDPQKFAVGGDSAGGNLSAVVALALRDADSPVRLKHQLLIYPATDMRMGTPSHSVNGQGYMLTRDSIIYFRGHYIDDPAHYADWRSSPLLHPNLAGLPPALVLTAGFDPLRDEGLQYADALSAAGVPTQYLCFERQIHGFITMGRVLAEADTAIAVCANALRRAFA